jgi:hypothetical protein
VGDVEQARGRKLKIESAKSLRRKRPMDAWKIGLWAEAIKRWDPGNADASISAWAVQLPRQILVVKRESNLWMQTIAKQLLKPVDG